MPVFLGYLVTDPAPADPFQTPGVTPFVGGGFLEGCDENFQDQLYFLGILERNYPQEYVAGLKSKPSGGFELFQAAAKVGERLSIAVNRLECCSFIMTSEGGKRSTGTVELFRDTVATGTFMPGLTVKAGSIVSTKFGRNYVLTGDAVFAEYPEFTETPPDTTQLGPIAVAIIAVDIGWEYNVPGQVIARNGEVLEGEISVINCLIIDPFIFAAESLKMNVRQVVPTANGQSACLDGLAEDLDIFRNIDEGDPEFRVRIRASQDTITCAAICRGIDKLLKAIDPTLDCCIRDVGTPLLPGFFYDAGSSVDSPQVTANNYAYDMDFDLRPADRFKVYLSTVEMRGFFILCIPPIQPRGGGMFYDGSDNDSFPLQNAYDDTSLTNADSAWDGFEIVDGSINKSITDLVREKIACGVGFDFCIDELGCS